MIQDAATLQALVLPFVVVVPAWLLGDIVRQRRLEAIARTNAAERALHDAEERVSAAVAEERRTMARELHDVVAHGVSVMLIQAGAARQVVAQSPERATEALLTVEATGREAMAELRRLLGVLDDEGEGPGVAPQPGIDQLGVLLDRVRDAGLPARARGGRHAAARAAELRRHGLPDRPGGADQRASVRAASGDAGAPDVGADAAPNRDPG